ncbi:MAG: hypothetical protein JO179_14210 [Solirubrobacterales bacterium]|nr:hypothetical protein [Solirubrobacterales bacterium]
MAPEPVKQPAGEKADDVVVGADADREHVAGAREPLEVVSPMYGVCPSALRESRRRRPGVQLVGGRVDPAGVGDLPGERAEL